MSLIIDNISYQINQKAIINNFGICLKPSSILIIKGNNGSGKTTILELIAGLKKPNSGHIIYRDCNIKDLGGHYLSQISYIGHQDFFKPNLTIQENLEFYSKFSDTTMLIKAALKYFSLEKLADIKISNLSKGQKKKAHLAKLLCYPSNIWLLDEPGVNLDQEGKKQLFNLISTKTCDDSIIILSTHDDFFDKLAPNSVILS